ncbi:MAG: carboxylesterase/lipase family protein [Candidatus Korobacteraceae bacterium]|jgi:para-nitrobenzyl esterase
MQNASGIKGKSTIKVRVFLACLAAVFSISVRADVYNEARPILEIKNGKLQGVEEYGVLAFKNIPYAAPPLGELRWRPPQPAQNWQGVRDASQFGQACLQPMVEGLNPELIPGSEDCLKLNVYTPKSGKNLPVMVWIHGGALLEGSATEPYYTPIALVQQGVIVVTLDYRLGKLGFFAPKELAEEAAKNNEPVGNYGIMDQIAALKWVRENIGTFGGDPNNVTIFGESAGGRSVTWLMTSPAAEGLFHKAIAESAQQTPLRGQTEERHRLEPAQELDAKYMKSLDARDLQEMRALPADKLVMTPKQFEEGEFGGAFIDGKVLIGDPIPLFAHGKQHKVPFIIGTNSWDASFFVPSQPVLAQYLQKMGQDPQVIERLYSDFKDKCVLPAEVMADAWYRGSVKLLADSAGKAAPSYAYYFDYLTPHIRASHPGAPHTFELPFVFGTIGLVLPIPAQPESGQDQCSQIEKASEDLKERAIWSTYWFPMADENDKQDRAMSQQLSSSWAAFAKTGNPNVSGQAAWPQYNLKNDVMREFNQGQDGLVHDLEKNRVDYQIRTLRALYKTD